jgi:transcriptional regulator with XRE-family HTH domain
LRTLKKDNQLILNGVMNLQNQLRLYLEHLDLTAAQLSRKSGVSQQVLSQWLHGAEPKKVTQLKKVSEALGCTVDHLCFGEGLKPSMRSEAFPRQNEWLSGLFEVKIRRVK